MLASWVTAEDQDCMFVAAGLSIHCSGNSNCGHDTLLFTGRFTMPTLISTPTRIEAAGNKPKLMTSTSAG